ncbi:DUF4129 domain-containing protein [Actinoplanes sp. TBRC 11911]|uniref:DUF4129 domain-containing protein n=1 Tax=Actinoplanes sp. TBRC 11911 TaxID=2729386 RepID=UPI00145DDD1C|nr:DUF4129 domain-containing protein [Actinoplanes sp. TBRC 11911]NMO54865.1 DUF4129 domain-containing protein [Actinoplanes sp. TBRC 11911]
MTRDYDEFLARLFDTIGPGWVALFLLAAAVAAALLWYTFPAWLRFRFFSVKFFSVKRKPRKKKEKKPKPAKPEPRSRTPEPELEPQPMAVALSPADRLAAEGRYAEAIRERLRESVATLTRHRVIAPAPAWTAHEVAANASQNRPAVSAPLAGATDIFAEVWYGHRPAGPDEDARMRRLTAEVKAALESPR